MPAKPIPGSFILKADIIGDSTERQGEKFIITVTYGFEKHCDLNASLTDWSGNIWCAGCTGKAFIRRLFDLILSVETLTYSMNPSTNANGHQNSSHPLLITQGLRIVWGLTCRSADTAEAAPPP